VRRGTKTGAIWLTDIAITKSVADVIRIQLQLDSRERSML
jgi:hypothetical protein